MPDVNEAKFTIDGSPSTDPATGDPKYVATNSQTLDCTLETSPSSALAVAYEVFDPTDSTSPLASYQATNLTWVASGLPRQELSNPNGTAQVIMPATGVHSYMIRCTVTLPDRTDIFERIVAIEDTLFTPAIRKTIPAEVEEYYARGYSDELNKMVGAMGAIGTAFGAAGTSQGAYISTPGAGQIDIAAGAGYLRTTASVTGTLVGITWASQSGVAIPADTTRYVGVEYNAGSPQAVVRATNTFNGLDDFIVATVYSDSGTIHILEHEQATVDGLHGTFERFFDTFPLIRDERTGGLMVGDTGTRNVTLTAGALYDGLSRFAIGAIDTSGADTFDYYYRDGVGGWTNFVGVSQYSSTQYDDNSGALQPLTAGNYGITWWYLESDGHLVGLYGWGDYASLSATEDATPPSSIPPRVAAHGILVGRTIVVQGGASATEVESIWDSTFGLTAVTSHLSLTDIGTNTHPQIDAHIASTANPHQVTLDQAYDGSGAGAGRTVTVDNGAALFNATDTTSGVLQVVQTPSVGTVNTVASFQAQGANWNAGSKVVEIISDDNDAIPLTINDGAVDLFIVDRAGNAELAGDLIFTSSGNITTTLGGNLFLSPNTTGTINFSNQVNYLVNAKVVATSYTNTSGTIWDISAEPAAGANSTADILHLFAEDSTAAGTRWAAGAHVLFIETDDNDAIPLTINDGSSDTASFSRAGALALSGNITLTGGGTIDTTGGGDIFLSPNSPGKIYATQDLYLSDDKPIGFGGVPDSKLEWDTNQSNHSLVWGIGNTSKALIFCKENEASTNYAHANKSDPTIVMQADASGAWSDIGNYTQLAFDGLLGGTMAADNLVHGFTIKAANAFAGATGANRDGGILTLLGGTEDGAGTPGIVKVGAGTPNGLTEAVGALFVTNDAEIDGHTFLHGALTMHQTTVSGATYSTVAGDLVLWVTRTATGPCTITITTALITAAAGRLIGIKDAGRNASVNNITILTQGAELIEGEVDAVINVDGDMVWFQTDGTDLFVA
jgi:hypothetical protein